MKTPIVKRDVTFTSPDGEIKITIKNVPEEKVSFDLKELNKI